MSFNPMQGQGMVQISKRPITDEEQANALVFYNSLRNGSRGIAVGSMFLAVLNVAVLSGAIPLAELAILFMVLALAIGLGAMALGVMTLKARKKIDAAFKEGYVIEVRAPAYLNRTGNSKVPMYNVGPVSVLQTPETQTLLVEGAPALVVCIPGVGAALSVNGVVLKRGATVKMPPNLASMATALADAPAPQYQSMQGPSYPPQQQQPFPQQAQQSYPQQPYPQQAQQPYPQQPFPQQAQQSYPQQPYPQQPQQPYQQQPFPQQAQQPYSQQPYPQQAQQSYPQQPYPQQTQQPYQQQPFPQQAQQPYPQPQQPFSQQPQQPYPQEPYQQQPQQSYPPQPVAGPPPAGQK